MTRKTKLSYRFFVSLFITTLLFSTSSYSNESNHSEKVLVQLNGLVNATHLIGSQNCAATHWAQAWLAQPNPKPSFPILSVYLGEQETVQDHVLYSSRYRLLAGVMDKAQPGFAVLGVSTFDFGVRSLVRSLKKFPGSQNKWLFDYSGRNVPWRAQMTKTFTSSGKKFKLNVVVRNDDFNPHKPVYLDYPYRRRAKALTKAAPVDFSQKNTLFVVRPTEESAKKLPRLGDWQWGIALVHALPADDQEDMAERLERRGWLALTSKDTLFEIQLFQKQGAQLTNVDCPKQVDPKLLSPKAKRVAGAVEWEKKSKPQSNWDKILAILNYDLAVKRPEEKTEKPVKGYWLADALRKVSHADFAVVPTYAIGRKPLRAGKLTQAKLLEAFPVDERVYVVDLTGREIKNFLKIHPDLLFEDRFYPFFYSGRPVEIRLKAPTAERVSIQRISDNKYYKVVTLESMITHSKKFFGADLNGMATRLRFKMQKGLHIFTRHRMRKSKKQLGVGTVSIKES